MRIYKWLKGQLGVLIFLFWASHLFAQKNHLIEFGWDFPTVSQLSNNKPVMQTLPFDGICFSFQKEVMLAFDTLRQLPGYYETEKIKKIKWGKYDYNFVLLSGYGKTGPHWFDDESWDVILRNMTDLSKAISSPEIKGVLFDPEYYYPEPLGNPWTYNKTQYPNQSYTELKAQVKKRGRQFIKALQQYKNDLSFLSIFITSLIIEEKINKPIESTSHALLVSFIEGILEAKNKGVKVIDGNESGYWYSMPSQFLSAGTTLRKTLVDLVESKKAKAVASKIEIAHPVFYDGVMGLAPQFEKGVSTPGKWNWLLENTKLAIASSDDITWFYGERLNWWKGQVNDTLRQILAVSKNVQLTNIPLRKIKPISGILHHASNINEATGYFYFNEPGKPMEMGSPAFTYFLDPISKKLSVHFLGKPPSSLSIFINNILFNSLTPKSDILLISLKKISIDKLVLFAKYADNSEALSIEIFK